MKKAVAHLFPYIEAEKDENAKGKGRIVMATVKGDVHDIGKNIVGVVLQCNGFEVIDLGVMVPWTEILKSANDNQADMIGLSGLITPSLDEMVTVAEEMQRARMSMPLLIGGATTSRVHTALRIAPAYEGPVVHVLDASRAVGVASNLVSDTQAEPFVQRTREEYEDIRRKREGKGQSELVPIADARANGFAIDPELKAPAPLRPGLHVYDDWDLADLRDYIDWTPFFRSWELAGNFPAILEDEVVGESATSLYADAQKMLDRIIAEKWLTAKGVVGLWPCRRDGDDVLISSPERGGGPPPAVEGHAPRTETDQGQTDPDLPLHPAAARRGPPPRAGEEVRIPFLRQQIAKRAREKGGRANMCLADFIDPDSDWIGGPRMSGPSPRRAPMPWRGCPTSSTVT